MDNRVPGDLVGGKSVDTRPTSLVHEKHCWILGFAHLHAQSPLPNEVSPWWGSPAVTVGITPHLKGDSCLFL